MAFCLWCGALGGAIEAAGVSAGWFQPTRTSQVVASVVVCVVCVGLWSTLVNLADAEGRHSAEVRTRVVGGIREAIARGEVEVPGSAGPPYAVPDRRSGSRPRPGGRRRDNPPSRGRHRGGPR